ncbi:2,5-dioxovalerate dehydrogenase [Saccharomonospora sp. CUA-673]|uniref:aldehyde dehydrogenase (NADP(+)) n=1 Tax=Saccharomonospora sp. CUA-673 TaxID=1904969 RepID=UPI0009676E81|nr:aldehyde dehydrogenase (NADP(+)) [Saccharomonospora sp. CUA-673]OLT43996.1 2,5-dioxovalerate dehydrogenase [Saccharomonospora sp. CUA-673]
MTVTGRMIIAGESVAGTGAAVRAVDPSTGEELDPAFAHGTGADVERACAAAWEAFGAYRALAAGARADFLDRIAANIEAVGDELVERAHAESGLPVARLTGERGRTTGQLRMFATLVRDGNVEIPRIDPAQPDRTPPRADIRQREVPLGPVAVFGASNFPLAFSVAGGDTASALAAGCPVVVKGHDAHPGTSELVGRAIADAVAESGLPTGTFSLLFGYGPDLGTALVSDRRIRAVGFTGSRQGGLALVAAAQARPRPIPVYAEMSSTNPVFLLPGALAERAGDIGAAFVGSLTLGAGQFCTNPGIIIGVDGPDLQRFVDAATEAISGSGAATMLTPGIADAYASGVTRLAGHEGVEVVAQGPEQERPITCRPVLFATDADRFVGDEALQQEVFGSAGIVVRCKDVDQLHAVADALEGQLTATVHTGPGDERLAADLLPALELLAGRVLFNGWPTGVEVGHAMVHGGPFPSTSDSRTTSVGTRAVERFLRPVAYQDVPAELLPSAIADGNPDGLLRRVDGVPGKH